MDEDKSDKAISSEKEVIQIRKEKIVAFFKKSSIWIFILLIIALLLGIYIRSLPMADHNKGLPSFTSFLFSPSEFYGGRHGLIDITTNTWTLGPDLDPWLFLRYAENVVEDGEIPTIDKMRNVPLGFDTSKESQLLPYMIAYTYYLFNKLGFPVNIEFAGVVFPVIMFALTIISFFFFVREIFIDNSKESILRANVIALISSFFMIVTPVFLSRTVAGIPEKESAAFFFMFLAFYFFLKSWKVEKEINAVIFGILAGISTAVMGLIWGGVIYAFIPMGFAGLIAFILNKVQRKEMLAYGAWVLASFSFLSFFSGRYDLIELSTSISSGIAAFSLSVMIIHFVIFNTKLSENTFIENSKLPKTILSLILTIVLIVVLSSIFLGPGFLIDKIKVVHQTLFKPIVGRWNITVAENKQPYFLEWSGSFGPHFKNIPIVFWFFFIGSVVLFRKALENVKKKDAFVLTLLYIVFLVGLIFSRYSSGHIFNGENFISKAFYYLTAILFAGGVIYFYSQYYKNNDKSFEKIKFEYIVLFCLFVFTLFTARGAVRLVMVLGPIAPIFVGFLIVMVSGKFFKTKEGALKIGIGVLVIIILIAGIYSFRIYYQSVQAQAYSFIPSAYNVQWQKAMQWVRENTPENSVFAHWWDYGYWVQSIGKRATVTDGGNAITYWNYLSGRHVLTGDNQKDALDFLHSHNATYLLIDSTDIGKYTAFSSIGSDINYDRYSWIGTFILDERQTRETNNATYYAYMGGVGLDEDLVIEKDGKEIFLPKQSTGVGAVIVPATDTGNGNKNFQQPYAIMVYQGQQYEVKMRYLYLDNRIIDFKSGIEAALFIFPRLDQTGQGIRQNPIGASMFISPRLFRGMLSQIYILNDPLKKFPNIKPAHSENSLIVDDLRSQGMNIDEFVYFNGVHGPIKIWEINYTGNEEYKFEYVDTDPTKYISWEL